MWHSLKPLPDLNTEDIELMNYLVEKEMKSFKKEVWYPLSSSKQKDALVKVAQHDEIERQSGHKQAKVKERKFKERITDLERYIREMNKNLEISAINIQEDITTKNDRVNALLNEVKEMRSEMNVKEVKLVEQDNEIHELKRQMMRLRGENNILKSREILQNQIKDQYRTMLMKHFEETQVDVNITEKTHVEAETSNDLNGILCKDCHSKLFMEETPLACSTPLSSTTRLHGGINPPFEVNHRTSDNLPNFKTKRESLSREDVDEREASGDVFTNITLNAERVQKEVSRAKTLINDISDFQNTQLHVRALCT